MTRLLAALTMLCLSASAWPCRVSPSGLHRDHAALVDEAPVILLVEAAPPFATSPSSCQFRTIRPLKGRAPDEIPILCRSPTDGEWMTDFSAHDDASFWQQRCGRALVDTACTLIQPAFTVGHKYLLFLGIAPDTKQFEEIAGPADKWLLFVEQRLSRSGE